MGTVTNLYDEILREHGNPLCLINPDKINEFQFLNCKEEIMKLVFENADFKEKMISKNIHYETFEDIDVKEYQGFLNKLMPDDKANIRNWLGFDPEYDAISTSRENAIQILFALGVKDILKANQFILRSCGDEAYAFYSRDYKDLIYKFCLQQGKDISKAEDLIKEHKYIERCSYKLLNDVFSDISAPAAELTKLLWETFYGGSVNESKKGGKKFIKAFCTLYGIDDDIKKAKEKINIITAIDKYEKLLKDDNSYDILKSILSEFSVCEETRVTEFIEATLCDEFYRNEISGGKRVIYNFCEKVGVKYEDAEIAVLKYIKNFKLFTNIIDDLAEKYDKRGMAIEIISSVDWIVFYENEKDNGIIKIREFCQKSNLDSTVEIAAIEKYETLLDNKNKKTSLFSRESSELENEEALKKYLKENQNLFGMFRRTAFERFKYYYELMMKEMGVPAGIDDLTYSVKYNKEFAAYEGEKETIKDELCDELDFEGIYEWLISVGDEAVFEENEEGNGKLKSAIFLPGRKEWDAHIKRNKQRSSALSIIQRIIRDSSVINDSQLKDMRNFKEQILRKYFIWIFMSVWGDIQDAREPIDVLNKELSDCGFPTLNSRNPYDFIIMNAMFFESRIEVLKWENEMPAEEIAKLESIDFSAFDEIKRVVKEFYSIVL